MSPPPQRPTVSVSQHTLFIRGFPVNVGVPKIREFFSREGGKCSVELTRRAPDSSSLFVALRFDEKEDAKHVMDKFDKKEVFGSKIDIQYFKDFAKYNAAVAAQHGGPRRTVFRGRFRGTGSFRGDLRPRYDPVAWKLKQRVVSLRPRKRCRSSSRSVRRSLSHSSGRRSVGSRRSRCRSGSSTGSHGRGRRIRSGSRRSRSGSFSRNIGSPKIRSSSVGSQGRCPSVRSGAEGENTKYDGPKQLVPNPASFYLGNSIQASTNASMVATMAEARIKAETKERGMQLSSVTRVLASNIFADRHHVISSLSAAQLNRLQQKRREVELAYKQDCETFSAVVKMLLAKDNSFEERLLVSLRESLKDIGQKFMQDLNEYVDKLLVEEYV